MEEKKKEQKVCPYAKKCGGCTYQGIPYKVKLGKKQDQVKSLLKKIGADTWYGRSLLLPEQSTCGI